MIAAIIKSVEEPQLSRCVEAVKSQAFYPVIHVQNISPTSKANQIGMGELFQKIEGTNMNDCWFLWVDGDMILYPDAFTRIQARISTSPKDLATILYGLYDPFINQNVCCLWVNRLGAYNSPIFEDILEDHSKILRGLIKTGWKSNLLCEISSDIPGMLGKGEIIGTHFEDPDEFQVFRRFRVRGTKALKKEKEIKKMRQMLQDLYKKTKAGTISHKLYLTAITAFEFGMKNPYQGSHHVVRDYEEFEKFRGTT